MEIAQVSTATPTREILSVAEIVARIKKIILDSQSIKGVFIRGEISGFKLANSNVYFNLKDERAVLKCLIWPHIFSKSDCKDLKDGDKVVLGGDISFYDGRSEVQLHVQDCQLEGVGKLYKQYVELKVKLSEEGLFAQEGKKPIPNFPSRVGIVTSLTGEGKAKHDFLRILMMGPSFEIVLVDSRVQGDVAKELCQGIAKLDGTVDIIIIGRGGGSIEDLWVFNDEELARAIARCKTPVISAVGHETDEVISDFVADCRAQTPTDAANIIVSKMNGVVQDYEAINEKLHQVIKMQIQNHHRMLNTIDVQKQRKIIYSAMELSKKDLDHTNHRFQNATFQKLSNSRNLCNNLTTNLNLIGGDLKRREIQRNKQLANIRRLEIFFLIVGIFILLVSIMFNFDMILKSLIGLIGLIIIIINTIKLKHSKKVKRLSKVQER